MELKASYSQDGMGHILGIDGPFNKEFIFNNLMSRDCVPYTLDALDSERHTKGAPASVSYVLNSKEQAEALLKILQAKNATLGHTIDDSCFGL